MYFRSVISVWLGVGFLLGPGPIWGAFPDGYNHPELEFVESETAHFRLIYQKGLDSLAEQCAVILERIYEPVCKALGTYPPEKTPCILTDYDDVGRNFAVRLEHRMYISQPVVNQARIGRTEWLTHLLAHEFTHVVNYWALRRAYGEWGEWAGMELQPQWFTEGLAEFIGTGQVQRENSLVLQAAREQLLIPLGKLDLAENRIDLVETWLLYSQAHSLAMFLARQFGQDVFQRILDNYSRRPVFEWALRETIGLGQRELFQAWWEEIQTRLAQVETDQEPLEEGSEELPVPLETPLSVRWSPDGQWIAIFGIQDWEEPVPGLYLMRADGSGWRRLADNLDLFNSPKFSWSPEGKQIVYCGRYQTEEGAVRNGLFIVDLSTGKSRRLTGNLRATEPDWSPNGRWIAFSLYEKARSYLAVIRPNGTGLRVVTVGQPFDVFQPTWAPDSRRLAFSLVDEEGTDIAVIRLDGTRLQRLTQDVWPDQFPAWSPTGEEIAFMSYRGDVEALYALSGEGEGLAGIASNLYTVRSDGSGFHPVTAARTGGTFYPSWLPDGKRLAFSLFRTRAASLHLLTPREAEAGAGNSPPIPTSTGPVGSPNLRQVDPTNADSDGVGEERIETVPAPKEAKMTPPRPYRGWRRLQRVVSRPFTDQDGLGDTIGVRTTFTDPLRQHNVTLEAAYGLDSEEWNFNFGYVNDQTRASLGFNLFQRVPDPRLDRGALVADRARGVEFLARLPVAPSRSPWVKDVYTLGLEFAERTPFRLGLPLSPAPQAVQVNVLSLGWQRDVFVPNRGNQSYRLRWARALSDLLRSDLDFTQVEATYLQRWQIPDRRRMLSLGLQLQAFEGDNFGGRDFQQQLFLGELRYDWRVANQLYTKLWPYFYAGRLYLSAILETRDVLAGEAGGIDLRERVRLELRHEGWLTRGWKYEVRLGPRFFFGTPRESEFFTNLTVEVHDLTF
ncbi:MAG TPA: hypothetical protein EYP85_05520 [Armatimonadetes bacterium]|nr:hypothetical protein [Armatimonadota bacterium]